MSGELSAVAVSITIGALIISIGLGAVINSLDRIAEALEPEERGDQEEQSEEPAAVRPKCQCPICKRNPDPLPGTPEAFVKRQHES